MNFRHGWTSLHPRYKRWVVIAGAVSVLVIALGIFTPSDKGSAKRRAKDGVIAHVLTDADTRKVSIDALDANVKTLQDEKERVAKELAGLKKERDAEKKERDGNTEALGRELRALRSELDQWKRQGTSSPPLPGESSAAAPDAAKSHADVPFAIRVISETGSGLSVTGRDETRRTGGRPPAGAPVADGEKSGAGEVRVYLPPGSILTGRILTGLDAPTGQAARRDPVPVLVQIQKEAILPNYFRADIRECFLMMSGYGDLSAERAFLRGEAFSCVRTDGKVIDTPLASYAAGEDGKAGVRGRLVSKQGALIARAMVAAFLEAFSSVFQRAAVPTINLSTTDATAFQKVLSSQSVETGAVAGVGKALDRLSQYYIDMAEQMFPVIEVDAGREIDIVITTGTALKLKN